MTGTRYWLASPATKIWIMFCILLIALTAISTMYYLKPKPNINALDLEIAKETLKNGSAFCMSIKAKNYVARASGMDVSAGCSR